MGWEDIFYSGSNFFLLLPSLLDKQSKSEMDMEDIFFNGSNCVSVEIDSIHPVNRDSSMAIHILKIIVSMLILLLVFQALHKMYGSKLSFINILVFLDIFNAAGHVPFLSLIPSFEYVLILL